MAYIKRLDDFNILNLSSPLSELSKNNPQTLNAWLEQLNALPQDTLKDKLKNLSFQTLDKYFSILKGLESGTLKANDAKVMLETLKAIDSRVSAVIAPKDAPKELNVNITLANRLQGIINKAQGIEAPTIEADASIIDKKSDDDEDSQD